MVVDANRCAVCQQSDGMAGKMNFADRSRRQRVKIGRNVPAVIAGTHEDVVDIAKNAATGARGCRSHELPLWNSRMGKSQISRRVFNQNESLEIRLGLIDVATYDRQRLFSHRQGQQIRKIIAADDTPSDVLRNQTRLDAFCNLPDALEMRLIEPLGAAERKPDA